MSARIIDIDGLQRLLSLLHDQGREVVGPRVVEEAIVLGELRSVEQLPAGLVEDQAPGRYRLLPSGEEEGAVPLFAHTLPTPGWRSLLHPPEERLWQAQRIDGRLHIEPTREQPVARAFFGIRACDLEALAIQDRVLTGGPFVDPGYRARRASLFLVAVNCTRPAATCFCSSLDAGPEVKSGYDLVLTELTGGGHRFLLEAGSAAGEALLRDLPGRPATDADTAEKADLLARARRRLHRRLPADTAQVLSDSLEHPHWQKVAERCLACGNCTGVCPTCFCSRMVDRSSLDGRRAEHWRLQDSCFDSEHSHLHGGPVRRDRTARYRHWLTHKLLHWQRQFGTPGCTGCGRCITWCPVGIDLTQEVQALAKEAAA